MNRINDFSIFYSNSAVKPTGSPCARVCVCVDWRQLRSVTENPMRKPDFSDGRLMFLFAVTL